MNIETSSLEACDQKCEMNIGAVGSRARTSRIVGIRPTETESPRPCLQPSNGSAEWSWKKGESALILTREQHPGKALWKCCRDRIDERIRNRPFFVNPVFHVSNLGRDDCWHAATKERASGERRSCIGGTYEPVLSLSQRSRIRPSAESNGPERGFKKCRLLARTSMMDLRAAVILQTKKKNGGPKSSRQKLRDGVEHV